MLVPSRITLTFLMCRSLLALQCEDSGTCDNGTPRNPNQQGYPEPSQEMRKMLPGFHKSIPAESPPKDHLNYQYESLLKSMKEMNEMLKHNQNPARRQTKVAEEMGENEYKSAREDCSIWATTNVAALMRASKFGNPRKIVSLVFIGTPVDAVDGNGGGRTPLHWAVSNGKLASANQLLQLGASVNKPAAGVSNNTPLHMAASLGDLEMVQLLLEYGADTTSLNSQCFTPLELSNLHGHHRVSEWLQDNAEKYMLCKQRRPSTVRSSVVSVSASPSANSTSAFTSLSTVH